jgi:colicin import membrane protein
VQQPRYSPALVFSVLSHVVVLSVLAISFEFSSPPPVLENVNNNLHVVNAIAVNAPEDIEPTVAPAPKPAHVEPVIPHPAPPPPVPVVQPQQPVIDIQAVEKQRAAQQKIQDAIALKALRKKQAAQQKALLQKQLLADLDKPLVKKPKIKSNAIAQSMAKEMREQDAKNLQQQLLQEQKRAAGAKAQGEVDKYKALILHTIGQRWLVPSGTDHNISAELLIRLAADGTVLDVQITKSSGNLALDRSAKAAVFKSSPLPVPTDEYALNQFRQFVLKMKPENLQQG